MTSSPELPDVREAIPFLIQGSESPVFRSRESSNRTFNCLSCGNCLIDGYYSECFLGVSIKCFRCSEISATPPLPYGEILPVPILTLGDDGKYLIGGTVDYNRSVVMTTDKQIAEANKNSSPKVNETGFQISNESLDLIVERFDILSNTQSGKRTAELARFHAGGRSGSLELPFDWSVWKIRRCLESRVIDIDDPSTNIALGRLYLFNMVDNMWRHHPRFDLICKEFSNTKAFFHTIGQFVLAGFYFENGLRIGFSVDDILGEKKPDLYIRVNAERRFFFEFKSPRSLIWTGDSISRSEIKKNVNSIIKKNAQINKSRPGVIVLMANHPSLELHDVLQNELRAFFDHKGRNKPYVAGAVAMHCGAVTREISSSDLRIGMGFRFENLQNQFCQLEDNPFREREPT